MLEDYGDSNTFIEEQSPIEAEEDTELEEDTVAKSPLPSDIVEGPFETVICGTSSIKIKREIFEDESDPFTSSREVESTPALAATMTKRLKATLSSRKDQIYVNETFPNNSGLVEHSMGKHPDAPSFSSADESSNTFIVEPSRQFITSETTPEGSNAASDTATLRCSPTTTPNYSATTTSNCSSAPTSCDSALSKPNPSVTNTVTRPSHWMERIYVSLKNIPVENRKSTRDKVLELVQLIADERLNPALVNFAVMSE